MEWQKTELSKKELKMIIMQSRKYILMKKRRREITRLAEKLVKNQSSNYAKQGNQRESVLKKLRESESKSNEDGWILTSIFDDGKSECIEESTNESDVDVANGSGYQEVGRNKDVFEITKLVIMPRTGVEIKEALKVYRCISPLNSFVLKSRCWKFYGHPADEYNEIIDKNRIVCQICHHTLKSNTNMTRHLRNKHKNLPQVENKISCCFQNEDTIEQFRRISDTERYSLSVYKWQNEELQQVIMTSMNCVCTENGRALSVISVNTQQTEVDMHWLEDSMCLINCKAVVINSGDSSIIEYFCNENIPIVQCMMGVIQEAVQECFALRELKEIMPKVYSILRQHGLPYAKINPYYWIAQWNTLKYFCDLSDKSDEYCADETVNIALETVKEIVDILQPLRVAVETLTIGNPIAGLAKPYVTQLLKDLMEKCILNYNMDEFVISVGETIYSIIKRHLDDYLHLNNEFLTVAKFFHPRFHGSCDKQEMDIVYGIIESFFDTQKGNNRELASEIDWELMRYHYEETQTHDPLDWWLNHSSDYTNLKRMADTYICVPAIVVGAAYMNQQR